MGLSQYDETAPVWTTTEIVAATSTGYVALSDLSASPYRLDTLIVRSTSPVDVDIEVSLYVGADNPIGCFVVPALSGSDGIVPTFDLLAALRAQGVAEIIAKASALVRVRATTALTSPYSLRIFGIGGYL